MAVVDSADAGAWALRRGATIVQLRLVGAPGRALEKEARALIPTSHVPVVIGSRCDVALAVSAYGVHLPEADIPIADARRLLGDKLLGRSVHSLEAARAAAEAGADYLIFGPVYESASHPGRPAAGLDALREVCVAVKVPVLAIGGVDGERVPEVLNAGAGGYAAIGAFAHS
jgi:thiamine-phosphate pyrophosphorylase